MFRACLQSACVAICSTQRHVMFRGWLRWPVNDVEEKCEDLNQFTASCRLGWTTYLKSWIVPYPKVRDGRWCSSLPKSLAFLHLGFFLFCIVLHAITFGLMFYYSSSLLSLNRWRYKVATTAKAHWYRLMIVKAATATATTVSLCINRRVCPTWQSLVKDKLFGLESIPLIVTKMLAVS